MQLDTFGLGRRPDIPAELTQLGDDSLTPGRVLAAHRGRWLVALSDDTRLLPARGRLRETPPVTGDWVAVDAGGSIAAVLERRGTLVRRAAGEATKSQVLAANVDLALIVEPLPDPNERRIERFAALAASDGIRAALVLTKTDVAPDGFTLAARIARRLGIVDSVAVSAVDGDGMGVVRALLAPGETAVLIGPSGAGKSTLANALLGESLQATGSVRENDGRGRHTTVARELLPLPGGACLIDTPGVREVGVWDGVGTAFEDVDSLAAGCRFADCSHGDEPGCAVREAIDPDRLAAWRKLQREQRWVDDRRAAEAERERRGRAGVRQIREAHRMKGRTP